MKSIRPDRARDWINLDRILLMLLTQFRRKKLTRTAIFFSRVGNGQLWLAFSLCMIVYSVPIGVAFHLASTIQFYLQIIIKSLFKRTRPYHVFADITHLYDPPDPYSFPSGHTAAVFTLFFVSQALTPGLTPIFLFIALSIAVSRIYLAVHYPSDILGGVAIAYTSAKLGIYITGFITGIPL